MNPWVQPKDLHLPDDLEPSLPLDLICVAVSEILYVASGRQFSAGDTATVRPCRVFRDDYALPWYMASWGGWGSAWTSWPFAQQYPEGLYVGLPSDSEYVFPGPVTSIVEVNLNGVVLTEGTDYALYNRRRLLRLSPTGSAEGMSDSLGWPTWQDLRLPVGQPNTWQVTYTFGKSLPSSGYLAAAVLAREFALAVDGGDSGLPARVTSVSREGVNAAVADPLAFLRDGFTGVPVVDQFIVTFNPSRLSRRAAIIGPDRPWPEVSSMETS